METNDRVPLVHDLHHQFFENNLSFWSLPTHRKALFEMEVKTKAVVKIQSLWRGYQARQMYKEVYRTHRETSAAIIIQRAVRNWLCQQKQNPRHQLLSQISRDQLEKLDERIKIWQENHMESKCQGMKQLEATHKEVQQQMNLWYAQAPSRELRKQRIESLCAQLEATSMILQGSPALGAAHVDTDFYQCPSLPLATEARLSHKRQVQALTSPWWKNLQLRELT